VNKTERDIVIEALARVEYIQEHIASLAQINNFLHRHRVGDKPDTGNLFELLVTAENNEWRNVFMWGLTLPQEDRDRIKLAAHEKYLAARSSVAHWWNDGVTPAVGYMVADEEAFREMARKAFAPEGGT
jgi:hypothetical protein